MLYHLPSPSPVKSFTQLVHYLFKVPGVKSFLSEWVSQDPLEKFFGRQRQRGGVNENPTVAQFLKALRVLTSILPGETLEDPIGVLYLDKKTQKHFPSGESEQVCSHINVIITDCSPFIFTIQEPCQRKRVSNPFLSALLSVLCSCR